ncbi:MAG: SulP family inorganic anion transporter, partial [Acidimicrobiia bacterium]
MRLVGGYRREWLRRDLVAGVVLTTLLVPQGMAYAELAGLPPVTGLYTTVLALVAYAAFGPSRVFVLGPDSALGLLIAAAVVPLIGARGDPGQAVALAGMLALLVGVLCIGAGFARLGVLAQLLSRPVRIGYLNGIAIVVLVDQLPKLFGFTTDATGTIDGIEQFVRGVIDGETVVAALLLGVASLVVIYGLRAWSPAIPGILIAAVGATVITAVLDLAAEGVPVVGSIPSGFPTPAIPDVSLDDVGALLVAAAGLAFVTLTDSVALSRSFASHRHETVDADKEIIALGAANVAAGLFQGFPVSASTSRTALAESAGSRTQLTGIVGAVGVLVVLVADGGLARDLPRSVLAAIIVVAAFTLFDVGALRWMWRVRRSELLLSLVALASVVILGALEGIVVAIALSLANFVRRAWSPYDAVLGRITGEKGYHDLDRHPEALTIPGLVLYRFDAPLFFANAELFARRVTNALAARSEPTRWIVVA